MSKELSTSTWKTIAQRELATRLIAEEQQRQMCEAVETRVAFIRGFQEMIQLQDKVGNFVQRKKTRVEPSDAAFYKEFLQDVDAIYAQTDTVLRTCGQELAGEDNVDSNGLWKEDSKTGFFLFTDNTFMPSDFKETCRILWDAGQLPHRQENRQRFTDVEDPTNTAAFKFQISSRLSTGRAVSAVQRVVTRRYQQEDRMVLVWQSIIEGEGMFTGMRAGET
ncbi:hypothetical protein PI126_g8756 [Phytophthora idaei]|nr:hypothetical protein PI126_g8756 [Phytophthora idaei]